MKTESRAKLRIALGSAQIVSATLTLFLVRTGTSTETVLLAIVTVSFTIASRLTFRNEA